MSLPARPFALIVGTALALAVPGCAGGGKTVALNPRNFEEKVLKSDKLVLVEFWAEWCGPCKMMNPILKDLAEEFAGKAVIGKVNADDYPEIMEKYEVGALPTFLFFKGGELKRRVEGIPKVIAPKAYFSDLLGALL